jgi:hypothetical protein
MKYACKMGTMTNSPKPIDSPKHSKWICTMYSTELEGTEDRKIWWLNLVVDFWLGEILKVTANGTYECRKRNLYILAAAF